MATPELLIIEDAYLLIPISQQHRSFLRFQWCGVMYEFVALPFGLATALYTEYSLKSAY